MPGTNTVGQKRVNIDRLKTSDSNWIFQRRFRDSSVRQYKYIAPRTGDELRVTAETDGLTSEKGHQRLGRASRGGR